MRAVFAGLVITCGALAFALSSGASAQGEYTYARHYLSGQVTRYTYTERDAGSPAKLTAVAQLSSFGHGRTGGETVRWIALTSKQGQNLDAQAQALPAYTLSLSPGAKHGLRPPRANVSPELQGPVDDLLTFFVDLSPRVGIATLHRPGDSHVDAKLLGGNFANATTPVGHDVIQLTTTLTSQTARQVSFRSAYEPPRHRSLRPYRPWMKAPVCGRTPNNFQLVMSLGTRYTALWGCERFVVRTVVDRGSGRIVSVMMTNPLHLEGRLCPTLALTGCTPIPAIHQQRIVSLIRSR